MWNNILLVANLLAQHVKPEDKDKVLELLELNKDNFIPRDYDNLVEIVKNIVK